MVALMKSKQAMHSSWESDGFECASDSPLPAEETYCSLLIYI